MSKNLGSLNLDYKRMEEALGFWLGQGTAICPSCKKCLLAFSREAMMSEEEEVGFQPRQETRRHMVPMHKDPSVFTNINDDGRENEWEFRKLLRRALRRLEPYPHQRCPRVITPFSDFPSIQTLSYARA